jgi:hypothetical protein
LASWARRANAGILSRISSSRDAVHGAKEQVSIPKGF